MKYAITLLYCVCAINIAIGQSERLVSLVDGMITVLPEHMDNLPYQKEILIINLDTKDEFNKTVLLMSDKKCFGTVLAVKMNNNLIYCAGYAPIIRNNRFTGEGEFILYKKQNAKETLITHIVKQMREETEDNQIFNYLEDSGFSIQIKDWEEVWWMSFMGYAFILPTGYFNYK